MKLGYALVTAITLFSANAFAVEVPGHMVYKMPSGDLVTRDVKIDVPPRGQGKVALIGSNFRLETTHFRSREVMGRTVFEAAFANPPGAPEGTLMGLTGSYQRGSNGVIYYGDVYSKAPSSSISFEASDFEAFGFDHHHGWSYQAGFMFTTLGE